MFPPATEKQVRDMGWQGLDIILVTGDAWIDAPHIGAAVIANVLMDAGYRVGIIAQPDMSGSEDITRLGEPGLFWGVTAGCMDSMVANYTANKKKRQQDDLTPGGRNNLRPDRAAIAYTNLIRRYFKNTRPIVLGGMEASLRRISHYDFWTDKVRRSVLFDAKADILVYGMGEKTVLEIAENLRLGKELTHIRGICYISGQKPEDFIELPPHARVRTDKEIFRQMFETFYGHTDPIKASGLCQMQDTRYLVCNPPQKPLSSAELDRVHELDFKRETHPVHADQGVVRALETIRFSVISHRGCFGECHFCAITAHQGKTVISRSQASIVREVRNLTRYPQFKGIISDVGGPTANMYAMECRRKAEKGACGNRRCVGEKTCPELPVNHAPQVELLGKLRQIPGIRHVFIGSGIRHDLILADSASGRAYLEALISHHISGQLKIAPEHSRDHILALMGKPRIEETRKFLSLFARTNRRLNLRRYLTCYFIAAYPGATAADMQAAREFARRELGFIPEQAQIFTPAPATVATLMYYTEKTFPGDHPLFVEKHPKRREKQKQILVGRQKGDTPK
ncbi:MAG: YgiQ family radical SAM protein [Desulfobacteraceae bacterium]|nr:YgiQ family radical SAM protein [Desulfobacteraceae bacterium]